MSDISSQAETPKDTAADSHNDPTKQTAPHRDPTLTHVPRVLIVEDTVELGEILYATLTKMQLMVFKETLGGKALERYNEVEPDIVLLDIGLPDMTGWRVLDAIKEHKTIYKKPAIIVMTAYGDPANRLMGKLQGVDDYLIKPFVPEDIQGVVRRVLGNDQDSKDDSKPS